MSRVYNFSAGPATLPLEVLQQAQAELLDWNQMGASILEISHRSPEFRAVAEQAEQDLRDLLNIPDNYHVLFLPGGGQGQFSMVPLHMLGGENKTAAYIQTGSWSKIAFAEAQRYGNIKIIADSEAQQFTTIPSQSEWQDFSDAEYLYYCDNETIHGLEFNTTPDSGDVPLICDMSSNLLTRPIDINKYGLIFACAQKNLGPSGITVTIIRDDLLQREPVLQTPKIFNYKLQAEKHSLLNTAPIFPWYITGLVFQWVKKQGGVEKMAELSLQKSKKLYDFIDNSDFYHNPVDPQYRSRVNVIFRLADESLNKAFLQQSADAGLMGLKGHRLLGGMRASIYNAMPMQAVDALIQFMVGFAKEHG